MPSPRSAQSPIDFRKSEITFVDHLPRIHFHYPQRTDVTLVNTGSPGEFATVRADVAPGAAFLTLSDVRYDLVQFHWHTHSEHEIEGRSTPLEMHFVHRRLDGSLLVIGVFMERGNSNHTVDPIFRNLPEHRDETCVVREVHLSGLLPDRHQSFRYSGSLTTPDFDENVQFIVLAEPIRLGPRQISAFQKLFPQNNCRKLQALNDREVLSDVHDW